MDTWGLLTPQYKGCSLVERCDCQLAVESKAKAKDFLCSEVRLVKALPESPATGNPLAPKPELLRRHKAFSEGPSLLVTQQLEHLGSHRQGGHPQSKLAHVSVG